MSQLQTAARTFVGPLRPALDWLGRRRADGVELRPLAARLRRELVENDVPELAAALSYRFLFVLLPFLVFVAAVGGLVARALDVEDPTDEALSLLGTTMPADASSVLTKQVDRAVGSSNFGLLTVSILATLWAATGGTNALVKAMNRAYDVDEGRPFWRRYLLSLALTIAAGLLAVFAFVVIVAGEVVGARIAEHLGAGGAFAWLFSFVRVPLALLAVLLVMSFVYWAAPNIELAYRWVTYGEFRRLTRGHAAPLTSRRSGAATPGSAVEAPARLRCGRVDRRGCASAVNLSPCGAGTRPSLG